MLAELTTLQDPRSQYPGPPSKVEIQPAPGTEQAMREKPDYAITKAAIANFTKGLSKALMEKHGIRVNAIAPGPIWTPLQEADGDKEKLKKLGSTTPYKRPGQPIELAPVYVLLASQEASYITGEIYGVTGGLGIV